MAEVKACGGARPAQRVQEGPPAPGFYRRQGGVYRLTDEGVWALLMSNGLWCSIRDMTAPRGMVRMTVEEVAAEGRRVVRCIVCGIKLTKPESIERGMGDICASKV